MTSLHQCFQDMFMFLLRESLHEHPRHIVGTCHVVLVLVSSALSIFLMIQASYPVSSFCVSSPLLLLGIFRRVDSAFTVADQCRYTFLHCHSSTPPLAVYCFHTDLSTLHLLQHHKTQFSWPRSSILRPFRYDPCIASSHCANHPNILPLVLCFCVFVRLCPKLCAFSNGSGVCFAWFVQSLHCPVFRRLLHAQKTSTSFNNCVRCLTFLSRLLILVHAHILQYVAKLLHLLRTNLGIIQVLPASFRSNCWLVACSFPSFVLLCACSCVLS